MKNNYPRLDVPESLRREMVAVARQFRKEATKSEQLLWQALRKKKLDGLKFRRKQPIGALESINATSPSPNLGEGKGGGE